MFKLPPNQLFPTKISFIVFVSYILLFVGQGILVTASQESDNRYDFNVVTVVLLTEGLKLVISVLLYFKDNSPRSLVKNVFESRQVLALYFVPALLYCLYNNLSFVNLSTFDPTTYFLMLQLRVVVTGVLFQLIFHKTLSGRQWLSLLILTLGCMLKQINFSQNTQISPQSAEKETSLNFGWSGFLIFVQIFCSCLAGVYNEYLLKNQGANVNIFIQNVFMYLDSIVCNLIVLTFQGNLSTAFAADNLSKLLHVKVLLVMFNNAAIGIVTSFFLKTLNSILKTFASALELILTAVLSFAFFQIPIYLNTALSIGVVLYAVYLYSQNPVNNSNNNSGVKAKEEDDESEHVDLITGQEIV